MPTFGHKTKINNDVHITSRKSRVTDLIYYYLLAVLQVEFSQSDYTSSEQSGVVPVTLVLRGGTSTSDITVTVIPSDQSPVSAEGKRCVS